MEKNLKFKSLILLMLLGVILLSSVYFLAYAGNFYNLLFWISILLIGIPVYLVVSDRDISQGHIILVLFIFGSILYLMRILPNTTNFSFQDELLHYETTKLAYEIGSLGVTPHFEISKYYSGLVILTVYLKYLIDLNIFPIAKILIGIIHSFVLVFIYLFLKEVAPSKHIAAIGTFIYATNPLFVFFDAIFSYESLGIFFVVFLLYLISKVSLKSNSIRLLILAIIVIFALTISHHFSSYMFLLFIVLLQIQDYINKQQKSQQYTRKIYLLYLIFLTITFILGWTVYIATITIHYLIDNFTGRLSRIFELSIFGGEKTLFSSSLSTSILPYYEFIIDTFLYAPLILLLALIGIFFIQKRKGTNIFTSAMVIYGPLLYLLSLGLIPTSGSELAQRLWGFVYIGLSFFVAVALDNLMIDNLKNNSLGGNTRIKVFSFFAVAIILIGGISIGDKPIHREPVLLSPQVVSGPGSITTDVYHAAEWFEREFGKNNRMTGDRSTAVVFNSYSDQNVERWHAWRFFFPTIMDNDTIAYLNDFRTGYIISDKRITKSLAEYGTYFSEKELNYSQSVEYGRDQPLPQESIDKLENITYLYKIYDGGNINLFKVDRYKLAPH